MSEVKFNFVIDCSVDLLNEYLTNLDLKKASDIIGRPDLCWCLQSYLILREKTTLSLLCSNELKEGYINIVHSTQLLKIKGKSSYFIVCVQADFPKRRWAHYHLVQNKKQVRPNSSYIPLWITPGLIKRDSHRSGVKRVAYAGQTFNGNLAGNVEVWQDLFSREGVEFIALGNNSWHNLSSIDVLIGIRSFNTFTHDSKPPSKLINAWHANIPFIGGYDSAYTQVGTPGKDYLRVKTPEEVLDAVLLLKRDTKLYEEMVNRGNENARQYTNDKIAKIWEEILLGSVIKRYKKWEINKFTETTRFNNLLRLGVLEHKAKQILKLIGAKKVFR